MAYTVLARKWRPKTFDEVVGQPGVTQTLRNAIAHNRLAHAFVFAGPRGVGKTTTARILARALNCVTGPTADPCGECDPCREIGEGRDIDVLEIDAATHTQVDKVREIIIDGLSITPVRNRYKVFLIDEVHRLSPQSFDALLKSIEEPPAHVIFMMATTELHKVPDTIQSRSQVFELKTIGAAGIAAQLRTIAAAEQLTVDEAAFALIARAAEGSMRDALSALDQVLAFAGNRVTAEEVVTVLGLVGRDLLLDIVQAVADEDAARLFELAGRAVGGGHDLRLVCQELSRLVRDLLVLSIDPKRLGADPEFAPEGDHDRLLALARRFSREDLLRAFDVLSKAEFEIRGAAQPRHHLEMALLRWVHLRKLVPLADLIDGLDRGGTVRIGAAPPASAGARAPAPASALRPEPVRPAAPLRASPAPAGAAPPAPSRDASTVARSPGPEGPGLPVLGRGLAGEALKDALLAEIKREKKFLYNTVVAQAQKIDVDAERMRFTFGGAHRALQPQLEQLRPWLEAKSAELAGRRIAIEIAQSGEAAPPHAAVAAASGTDLRSRAMAEPAVQAMLDVFPAEIRDVEEIK